MTLMGFDTFRDVDRVFEQAMGANRQLRPMPIEAFRHGDEYIVAIDLPGVARDDIEVRVERNMVTVRAQRRPMRGPDDEVLIDERPRGEFMRQLYLGDSLDTQRVKAEFTDGVLVLKVPVDESSKPRTVSIEPSSVDTSTTESSASVPVSR
jgi:HSP20 family protein